MSNPVDFYNPILRGYCDELGPLAAVTNGSTAFEESLRSVCEALITVGETADALVQEEKLLDSRLPETGQQLARRTAELRVAPEYIAMLSLFQLLRDAVSGDEKLADAVDEVKRCFRGDIKRITRTADRVARKKALPGSS